MGRVNPQTLAPAAPAPAASVTVTHFTHPHELHPISVHNSQALCSGCRLPFSGATAMYACLPCNFTLHRSCAALPRHITHPSHGGCALSLLTSPAYEGAAAFSCDACSRSGDGWSYHCTRCEYDLHVTCASKPMKIRHQCHVTCALDLTFKSPYGGDGFSCDVCRRIGRKQWLYRCNSCEFDAHLDCVGNQVRLQHHHSLPEAAPVYQNQQLMHSASTGTVPAGMTNVYGQHQFQNPTPGVGYQARPGGGGGGLGMNLMWAAMEGLVEGAFQEVGQTAAQNVLASDGGGGAVDYSGGGGVDGDGGGDSSAC